MVVEEHVSLSISWYYLSYKNSRIFVLLVYMHIIMQVEARVIYDIPTFVKRDTVLIGTFCNQ